MSSPARGARRPHPLRETSRRPSLETLENRSLMATLTDVSLLPLETSPPPIVAAAVAGDEVTQLANVTVLVNGRAITARDGSLLELREGDRLQVSGVSLTGANAVANSGGALAVEGYLRKTSTATPQGAFDYADGRFSKGLSDAAAGEATSAALGLQGEWKLQAGNNQLQLMLVHYQGDGSEIISRLTLNLQVGKPDFKASLDDWKVGGTKTILAGETISLAGSWSNHGKGLYSNYAEVDIFRADDLTQPVWVGSLVGTASGGQAIRGKFVNNNPNDIFAEEFVADQVGTYIVRVTADPENYWQESNEKNNVVEYKLVVQDPVAVFGAMSSEIERLEKRLGRAQARVEQLTKQEKEVPDKLLARIEKLTERLKKLEAEASQVQVRTGNNEHNDVRDDKCKK